MRNRRVKEIEWIGQEESSNRNRIDHQQVIIVNDRNGGMNREWREDRERVEIDGIVEMDGIIEIDRMI